MSSQVACIASGVAALCFAASYFAVFIAGVIYRPSASSISALSITHRAQNLETPASNSNDTSNDISCDASNVASGNVPDDVHLRAIVPRDERIMTAQLSEPTPPETATDISSMAASPIMPAVDAPEVPWETPDYPLPEDPNWADIGHGWSTPIRRRNRTGRSATACSAVEREGPGHHAAGRANGHDRSTFNRFAGLEVQLGRSTRAERRRENAAALRRSPHAGASL